MSEKITLRKDCQQVNSLYSCIASTHVHQLHAVGNQLLNISQI